MCWAMVSLSMLWLINSTFMAVRDIKRFFVFSQQEAFHSLHNTGNKSQPLFIFSVTHTLLLAQEFSHDVSNQHH